MTSSTNTKLLVTIIPPPYHCRPRNLSRTPPIQNMPAGRHRARKNFPLSAACNDDWEKECQQIASEQLGKKVAKSLNGQRFTAWRLCVERKRRELLYMLGAGNVPLAQMPEDIKGKVGAFGFVRTPQVQTTESRKQFFVCVCGGVCVCTVSRSCDKLIFLQACSSCGLVGNC